MDTQLTVKTEDLISLVGQKGLSQIIQPLTREIYLFDSFVAGTTHLQDKEVLSQIMVGDKLALQRENSKFDNNAIIMLTKEEKKLGYIPEKDNVVFARLMDAGKLLTAKITDIQKRGSFTQVRIGIYMVDF